MDTIVVRKAEVRDIENLTVLKQQVWIATYAVEGIRMEFSNYVLSAFTSGNIQKSLLDNDLITLVAELNNHIIGCVEVRLHPDDAIPEVAGIPEIAVLYVLERFCGMGVGQRLLDEAFGLIKDTGYSSTWLSVLYSNSRALSFYKKNRFNAVGTIYFEMDGNKYENKVMRRDL